MTSIAVDTRAGRVVRFYAASVGKKAVMALTGFVLLGYVTLHMVGNLQIYAGPEKINRYAEFLHGMPALLWAARVVVAAAVLAHVVAAVQLQAMKMQARPVRYTVRAYLEASLASRTMVLGGLMLFAFLAYHLAHLTLGWTDRGFVPLDAYGNMVRGFSSWPVSAAYLVGQVALGLHLGHGIWSGCQSLGASHPRYTPWLKRLGAAWAAAIVVGNCSMPLAVLGGLVR